MFQVCSSTWPSGRIEWSTFSLTRQIPPAKYTVSHFPVQRYSVSSEMRRQRWRDRDRDGQREFQCTEQFLSSRVLQVKLAQSCPTLCDPVDYTVHGIPQARILEWVAFPFSRGSSSPRDRTQVPCFAGRFFTSWVTGKKSRDVSK